MGSALQASRKKQPEPEINVTPLVDVVLVLLIIFMVIAPAINEGEHLELPSVMVPDSKAKEQNPIEVTLAANGAVIVEDERMQFGGLKSSLTKLHKGDPERALLLKTDASVPYKRVRDTFAMLQDLGFKGVSLKVEEAKKPGSAS
jgi:biopolymer transport protein TolR